MANRALERLGKQQGMFIDRHEVGQPAAGPVNLGSLGPPHRAARPYAQPTFAGFRTALVGVAFSQQPGRKPFGQEPPRPRTIAVMPGGLALPGM